MLSGVMLRADRGSVMYQRRTANLRCVTFADNIFVTCTCQERATIGRPPRRHTRNLISMLTRNCISSAS